MALRLQTYPVMQINKSYPTNPWRPSTIHLAFLAILISIFGLVSGVARAHEKQWPEKRLRQVWTTAKSFTSRQMTLNTNRIAQLQAQGVRIGAEDRSPIFYFAQGDKLGSDSPKNLGVIFFVDVFGENGKMEVSIAVDTEGRLKKVALWDQAENPGVSRPEFLDQFIGKTAKDPILQSKDFKPIPDAVKASQAVAGGVEKALRIIALVFERKS